MFEDGPMRKQMASQELEVCVFSTSSLKIVSALVLRYLLVYLVKFWR